MLRLTPICLALGFAFLLTAQVNAQSYNFSNSGGYGMVGNPYGGCGNQTDPRLGYCLKNDCYCQAGCGAGYGSPLVIVRVRVNGDGEPIIQTYPAPYGYTGGLGNNPPSNPANQRFARPDQARTGIPRNTNPSAGRTPPRTATKNAGYRYKF